MTAKKIFSLTPIFLAAFILPACGKKSEFDGAIIINEDNDRFFIHSDPKDISEAGLRKFIGNFKGGKITHFFMCPNGQRTSYKSKVHEAIWECAPNAAGRSIWCDNAKKLHDAGIDPYAVWIDECRRQKISPWITMRMNDVHFASTDGYFRNTDFWRDNPGLWRNPNAKKEGKQWTEYALNYKYERVRDYHFALVRELLERYDADGIELDWQRFPGHLDIGKGRGQAHFITDFMARVRAEADKLQIKRGRKIKISARVPATIENALFLGLDAVEWAKKGYVNLIVAGNFYKSADFNIPIAQWREALKKTGVEIVPSCDNGVACSPKTGRAPIDFALINGWACNCQTNGAKGLYFFNLNYSMELSRKVAEKGLGKADAARRARRHPATFRDYLEFEKPQDREISLPATAPCAAEIFVGAIPRRAKALVILAGEENIKNAEVKINGAKAGAMAEIQGNPAKYGGAKCASAWEIPPNVLREGKNCVSIETPSKVSISWCEIEIKGD